MQESEGRRGRVGRLMGPLLAGAVLLGAGGPARAAGATAAGAAGAATTAAAPSAVFPGPAFKRYSHAAQMEQDCGRGLKAAARTLAALERRPADAGWLAAYDRLNDQLEDAGGPIDLMTAVLPDKALRDAAEACSLRWQAFFSSLGQNPVLHAAASKLKPRDAIDAVYLRSTLDAFEDGGVSLPPAPRARAKAINDELAALEQKFQAAIREAKVRVAFSDDELKGVPEAVWITAPRDAQGRVLLGLDAPTYVPVMELADSAAARERIWRAKSGEGGRANLDLLAQIVKLRTEYAALFGQPSYAAFVLKRRMAQSPERAMGFLDDVLGAVAEREKRELEELRQAKARHLQLADADAVVRRWDVLYYTERVRRERYSVDQEAFRAYFPPEASLAAVMRLVEQTMGVRYERVTSTPVWHDEVRAYAVRDVASGRILGGLYVDLYPRDGKYNHAAVWPIRGGAPAKARVSQAALVVNFNRKGLTLDELETLLHEFGHSVHTNLSATRYSGLAGTSVKRDFVEAPSQMLEEWAYDRRFLALYQQVCASCPPVPDALLKQAEAARRYGQGVQNARQRLYAAYDLTLYNGQESDPMALWQRMEGATPLGHVDGTTFPAGFGHIAGGYAAGYYGYLWSLVLATDMRTAFGDNKLDPVVGQRLRRTVLGQGAQKPPGELVRDFLGRDFNARAFYADLAR